MLQIHQAHIAGLEPRLSAQELQQTVDLLLSWQNPDGGWATYERIRAPKWLEWLNPSEVFGRIMVEYSYTECSSSAIQALIRFHDCFPEYRPQEVVQAIKQGVHFILGQQLADGSWYGSWGVCFTYGSWFAIEALKEAERHVSGGQTAIDRGCAFLASKQNDDGGWGESFESCVQKKYIQHSKSQVVNTAWAALALMKGGWRDHLAIQKAMQLLMDRQLPNGD